MPLLEVVKIDDITEYKFKPYDTGYLPLVGVIMPDCTRRLFVARGHPLNSGRVFTTMRDGRSVPADFVDRDLANWLRDKVGDILNIKSFSFFSSSSLAVMDYNAMEHLRELRQWMFMRASGVSKHITACFRLLAPTDAKRKGVAPRAAFVALTPNIGSVLQPSSFVRWRMTRDRRTSRSARTTSSSMTRHLPHSPRS
jgi:hypothetical protein